MKTITENGVDELADWILSTGVKKVTREDWISAAWLGEPPEPWTEEHELDVPEPLQDWSLFCH